MDQDIKRSIRSFLLEILVYAGLVAGYYFLVLHTLGDWLNHWFQADPKLYAFMALGLIIGQGVLLEILTRLLLALIKSRTGG